jgi:hypothetical protein
LRVCSWENLSRDYLITLVADVALASGAGSAGGAAAGMGMCTWAAQTPEQLQEMSRQEGGWGRPWAELSAESKRLVLCLKNEWSAYICFGNF